MSTDDHQRPGARLPGPTVMRLAMHGEYCQIAEALNERPQDAYYEGLGGNTALNFLLRTADFSIERQAAVDAILAVDPKLAAKPDAMGWTPLHTLSSWSKNFCDGPNVSAWETMVSKIIAGYPDAARKELQRHLLSRTPFHYFCENGAPATALAAVLKDFPELAVQPYLQLSKSSTHEYPLFLIWASSQSEDRLPKMELLLRAATGAPLEEVELPPLMAATALTVNNDNRTHGFDILNAACRVNPCPREYLALLLQRYPNRVSWTDECGLLPLHHAILNAGNPVRDGFLIEKLLKLYPTGASCPFPNMSPPLLPLQYLIADSKANWPEYGIDELISAYPEALSIPDPRTGLVPALASAELAIHSRAHLSVLYKLLLKSPELFINWAATESSKEGSE